MVVVAVGVAAVVGAAHPGVQRRLRGADGHGVSLEDAENVIGGIVSVGQCHYRGSLLWIKAAKSAMMERLFF